MIKVQMPLILTAIVIVIIAGAGIYFYFQSTQQIDVPAGEPAIEEKEESTESTMEELPKVTVTDKPDTVEAGKDFTVTWMVDSPSQKTIAHTAVHFGSESNPGEISTDTGPGGTAYTKLTTDFAAGEFTIPNTFTPTITAPSIPQTNYFRAHAIVDGENYWSDEFSISITEAMEQGESMENETMEVSTQEFSIESDDNGYYIDGNQVQSIDVTQGNTVKINFIVRTTNVAFGGQEYRSSEFDNLNVNIGDSGEVQFTAGSTFNIDSYWPNTNNFKATLQIVVA